VIGMLAYRGPGFGNLFRQVKQKFDLPIVMIEWDVTVLTRTRANPTKPIRQIISSFNGMILRGTVLLARRVRKIVWVGPF